MSIESETSSLLSIFIFCASVSLQLDRYMCISKYGMLPYCLHFYFTFVCVIKLCYNILYVPGMSDLF